MFMHQTTAEWTHHQKESCRQRMFPSCMLLLLLNALNYLSTNTHSHLVHTIQSPVNHRIMRFAYLPWFVLGSHTWAEGIDEVTPGPCLAWLGASVQTSRLLPLLCAALWESLTARVWMLTLRANGKHQPNAKQTKAKQAKSSYTISVMSPFSLYLSPSLHLLVSPGKPQWLVC